MQIRIHRFFYNQDLFEIYKPVGNTEVGLCKKNSIEKGRLHFLALSKYPQVYRFFFLNPNRMEQFTIYGRVNEDGGKKRRESSRHAWLRCTSHAPRDIVTLETRVRLGLPSETTPRLTLTDRGSSRLSCLATARLPADNVNQALRMISRFSRRGWIYFCHDAGESIRSDGYSPG